MRRFARSAGFSLVEILVVMALIGIVIAIVARKVSDGWIRGQEKATVLAIDNLSGMIQNYIADMGAPPTQLDALLTQPPGSEGWMGPYASEKDLKDAWGRPFVYHQPGKQGAFDLGSYGYDGKPGGAGLRAADIGKP